MKANELRIGNIVKANVPGVEYCFIDEIRLHGDIKANYASISGWNSISWKTHLMPEPVVLTEEWLLKFGFKDNRVMLPGDGELEIRVKGGTFHVWPTDGQTESHNFRNLIDYVHQLQNLYFALTGEELTIK